MNSRDKILQDILKNQPEPTILPEGVIFGFADADPVSKFITTAQTIGAKVYEVNQLEEIAPQIAELFDKEGRIVSVVEGVNIGEPYAAAVPHTFEDVNVAIIRGHFGVAENGAIWVTEDVLGHRALPFICQHLVLIIEKSKIVRLMQDAYEIIADSDYGYSAFIAGPSKTADIEQSLVIGAHGPRSLSIFLLP
ncbi:LUD domain-containing protein [Mucilaginibacter gynuensis]|uniref:LUD domain-containing protein n=1 Tax=Mucilaginibacter gynuensis TaxID=1302236 RepID=A0ABP8FMV2_9SPHI